MSKVISGDTLYETLRIIYHNGHLENRQRSEAVDMFKYLTLKKVQGVKLENLQFELTKFNGLKVKKIDVSRKVKLP